MAEKIKTEKMIDIKRLHKVHKNYPNNSRREGKTTYCYDSLLRASQTDVYKELAYLTTTTYIARESFKGFIKFLDGEGENYQTLDFRTILLNSSKITFLSVLDFEFMHFDGIIEDCVEEYKSTPQYEEWFKRQLTKNVYR